MASKLTRVELLKESISLTKSVVKECETKVPDPANYWAFRLLAKMVTSAISVEVLLKHGCILDTKPLLRSMLYATIDLMLVLDGPLKTKQLAELYNAELVEDQYLRFKFEWERRGKTEAEFVSANPKSRKTIEAYKKQQGKKRKPPAGVEYDKFGVKWESRWRWLSDRVKLSYLPKFKEMMRMAEYGLRDLGNAHAHARPVALQCFTKMRKTNDFRREELHYLINPKPTEYLYSKEWLAFEACMLILVSCDRVIDQYYLDTQLSKRMQSILDRLSALTKGKGKSPAPSK